MTPCHILPSMGIRWRGMGGVSGTAHDARVAREDGSASASYTWAYVSEGNEGVSGTTLRRSEARRGVLANMPYMGGMSERVSEVTTLWARHIAL